MILYNNDGAYVNMAMIGLLGGFLVTGVLGIFIGDQLIQAIDTTPQAGDAAAIKNTFEMMISVSKIIIIVSVAGITFAFIRGLMDIGFGEDVPVQQTDPERIDVLQRQTSGNVEVHREQSFPPSKVTLAQPVEATAAEHEQIHTRWENLDIVEENDP
jgi:hypothetical protein